MPINLPKETVQLPKEIATKVALVLLESNVPQEQIAAIVGKSQPWVSNLKKSISPTSILRRMVVHRMKSQMKQFGEGLPDLEESLKRHLQGSLNLANLCKMYGLKEDEIEMLVTIRLKKDPQEILLSTVL